MSDFDIEYMESKIRCGINQIKVRGFVLSVNGWGVWRNKYNHWEGMRYTDGLIHLWPTAIFILNMESGHFGSQQHCISEKLNIPVPLLDAFNSGWAVNNRGITDHIKNVVYDLGHKLRSELYYERN